MKTKINTIIGIIVLGIIGFTNINATADSYNRIKSNAAVESDETLTIEPWMLENNYWDVNAERTTVESEAMLEIEAWMLNDEDFLNRETNEPKLEIEAWMTENNLWK